MATDKIAGLWLVVCRPSAWRWLPVGMMAGLLAPTLGCEDKPCPPPSTICVSSQQEADRKNADLDPGCRVYTACSATDGGTDATDAVAADDASVDASADSSPEAGSDAPGDLFEPPDVQEIPANREVRFHVANQGGLPLLLALKGRMCRSWQVEQKDGDDWKPLALSISNEDEYCSCYASCDSVGNENTWYEEVAAGGEKVVPWDGRSLVTWVEEHTCTLVQTSTWTTVEGVQQPVAPGRYRITVGLEAAPPCSCSFDETSGAWWCNPEWWASPSGIEHMCPAALKASAEFDLPETGDVDVTVSFPQPGPCEPVGTWEVTTYDCFTMPRKNRIVIEPDGDGGVTGMMTSNVPADAGSPDASSSVAMDSSKCHLTATTSSTWVNGDAPQCDLSELVAELHGDTGYGIMKTTYCNGHAPESPESFRTAGTAVLKREP